MPQQTVNQKIWSKLFLDYGVFRLKDKTGVSVSTLYKIKKDNLVPTPHVQRKLRDGLNLQIEEMFPFSIEEDEAAQISELRAASLTRKRFFS